MACLLCEQKGKPMNPLRTTLEKFLSSPDFRTGVIDATKASWSGSGYSVELWADGTWRVLSDGQIGTLYQSEGIILALPVLDTDGMQAYVDNGTGSEDDFLSEAFSLVEDDELEKEVLEAFEFKMA
jgi:hypothetical protein